MAPFNYINLDKHQAHKIDWERRDPAWDHWPSITNNLEAPTPFYDIETVFRQTFGYDLSDLIINRTALGSLGKLPTELIYHIFEAAGLHDGIILSAANGQLFVVGYPCMKAKIRKHPELSEDDTERLVQLQWLVVFRIGLESNTADMALVNVSKREYIRTMDIRRYVLQDVIPVLTCWGAEEEERGDWAGDRLALITWNALKERIQKEDEWKAKTERWAPYD
ncbi:hypothetical protein EYR38_000239 [Pleurotus pulmonarius]|nr:hypothetical protein EYR38_000239 [Pleurotus pulmonarius]